MAKEWVKLTFPSKLIKEPVTFRMAMKYRLVPNIRRAKVTPSVGELVIELVGAKPDLAKGLAYLRKRGVKVESVVGDVLE